MAAYYTRAKARSEVEPEDLEQRDSAYIGHHFADVLHCSQSPGSVLVRLSVCPNDRQQRRLSVGLLLSARPACSRY